MSQHFSKGFSLVELVVTVSIMSVILTIVLMGQSRYTNVASLNANINEAALVVRQAQTYGISVREFSPGLEEFNVGYGVSFLLAGSSSDKEYIFFADRGSADLYRYSSNWNCPTDSSSECLSKLFLTNGNTISQICYKSLSSGTESCMGNNRRMDITFTRPETSVSIRFFNASGVVESTPSDLEYGKVTFRSATGNVYKSLYVYPTGQISVRNGQ